MQKGKKGKVISTEDIGIDRGVVTKIVIPNIDNPTILEVNLSMVVIPKEQRDMWEYEDIVEEIKKKSYRTLKHYVSDNNELFDERSIIDINFTVANLKKGYNKSVQMTLFIKTKEVMKPSRLKNKIKETIKPTVNQITSKMRKEGFKCYKRKQKTNQVVAK